MAKDSSDRLAKLEQQQKKLAEKIKQEKTKLRREERERENRRRLILGELVLRHCKDAPEVRAWVDDLLEKNLNGNGERVLFGLAPKRGAPAQDRKEYPGRGEDGGLRM